MPLRDTVIFGIATLFIIWFSWWLSIKEKRYHGYARFFAFEGTLLLLLSNYKTWFIDPFSIKQIFSWLLLLGCIYPVLYGLHLITKIGKPKGKFENTTKLVTTGIYRFIRHPMYLSIAMLAAGIFLKKTGTAQVVIFIIVLLALYLTARIEEGEMIKRFKKQYRDYMKKSKMFLPYIF